jgi:hypothetical protein
MLQPMDLESMFKMVWVAFKRFRNVGKFLDRAGKGRVPA